MVNIFFSNRQAAVQHVEQEVIVELPGQAAHHALIVTTVRAPQTRLSVQWVHTVEEACLPVYPAHQHNTVRRDGTHVPHALSVTSVRARLIRYHVLLTASVMSQVRAMGWRRSFPGHNFILIQ